MLADQLSAAFAALADPIRRAVLPHRLSGEVTVGDRPKHEEMGVVNGWDSTLDCLDEYLLAITGR